MKKAQILGALALAFALGVVAPVATTSAATFVQNGVEVKDASEKIKNAITAAQDSCGYRTTSAGKTYYYGQYVNLINELDGATDAIETAEKDAVKAADGSGLIKSYNDALGALNGALTGNATLPAGVDETFPTDITTTYKNVTDYITNAAKALRTASTKISDVDLAQAYTTAAGSLEGALKNAADAIVAAQDGEISGIQSAIESIRDEEYATTPTYAQLIADAKALTSNNNGTCSVAKVRNLMVAITAAENLLNADASYNYADAEKAIAAINKAANGGTITDEDIVKPADSGNKAPDTGILSNEDGGASTTVAMVAGVATALTAAGAGVVAYRNARRSSRK